MLITGELDRITNLAAINVTRQSMHGNKGFLNQYNRMTQPHKGG